MTRGHKATCPETMDRGAAEETVLIRSLSFKREKPVSFLGSRLFYLSENHAKNIVQY